MFVRLPPASTSQSIGPTASQTKTPTLGAIAQSGMPQIFGLVSVDGKNPWILDLGATDHLIEHELGEDDWHCLT
ncbi:uncharacterized protein E5676_scaffold600G001560 [Cucumis melo var. makuwa]|uniref:Uncharacterized protein n=1 Tax=Cucumis melo var. makuwa TaxID=1194695 RepID=A0A5D3DWW6_CUCMM|nr:uncharacterized protein E5676_scaffold600G001560 [Cucumis melo var. makuwa]